MKRLALLNKTVFRLAFLSLAMMVSLSAAAQTQVGIPGTKVKYSFQGKWNFLNSQRVDNNTTVYLYYYTSKIIVSKGALDNPYNVSAQVQGTDLSFSWTDNSGIGNALETDKVMFLAYNTVKKQAVVVTDAADRSTRQASYSLPTAWVSDSIEVYLAVRRAEGDDTSTSLYLGSFNL